MILGRIEQKELKKLIIGHLIKKELVILNNHVIGSLYKDRTFDIWYYNCWYKADSGRTRRSGTIIQTPECNMLKDLYQYELTKARLVPDITARKIRRAELASNNELLDMDTRKWYSQKAYVLKFMLKDNRYGVPVIK